ncbi:hypothetical protein TPHA_0A05580 [Tetrapisispora phaffii CBS 4417]|uniref:Glycoside hydrolase family 17 protein n=1 Tax=Tetrapisispora phaffii (strain ATCC 24235 / CBS 4417 / NBRC 1672 / NRRL Y-8282 / UCD 70-5) TaxID=1071381 RepID=G8BP04_TETPH|nr:hypothetical protein TPHA_0A05580 [Tetrapisispora phaffii CBS 4417]CCE61632.1 hypothetical protein TPHA_0A05580 [Tetrapisispora phaffii CBS 4417]
MRFSTLLTSASLIGAAIAAPAGHQHNKRAVVTTTVDNKVTLRVTIGPNGETMNAVATENAVVANAAVAATTSAAAAAAATTSQVVAAATSTSSTVAAAASTSTSSSSSDSDFSAGAKGITYSPYNADGTCKSAADVASDLSALSDFSVIRLYGVDCNQVENVLKAKGSNQKLFLGIYYMDQIEAGISTIASAISSYGSWDDVYTVSIGNELVNSGSYTVDQVASFVATGRSALTAAGYTGPVVSVDTFIAVINNPGLCSLSDYMAVNAHAYFDYNTAAADAGSWVLSQIQRVWTACDGAKDVLITETGWPSQGETYGLAVPSKANQQTAISSIKSSCGADAILYNAYNDYWKADGAYGVEKYWGVFSNE